jgi:glyoxylase-like metal-dependent hydrolase (beta-lactamase superfamily II)
MLRFKLAKSIFFPYILFSLYGTAQNLKISKLTNNQYIFTTYQDFKGNKVSANGMYVLTRQGVVLLDTPWDSTQFQALLDSIEIKHKQKVVLCVATHSHEDRARGLTYYQKKGIKTYTSALTDSILKSRDEGRAQFHFLKDTLFDIGGCKFEIFYPGAGHTIDNVVAWFPLEKTLYGGCLIKSTEATDLGYIKESDLTAWPVTLTKLRQKLPKPKFIIPGHQDWKDTHSLDHTLGLLRKSKEN